MLITPIERSIVPKRWTRAKWRNDLSWGSFTMKRASEASRLTAWAWRYTIFQVSCRLSFRAVAWRARERSRTANLIWGWEQRRTSPSKFW